MTPSTLGGLLTHAVPRHAPFSARDPAPAPQFQVGGTVREGSLYVVRPADSELPQALTAGEFCYVLAPRQIGKSSLRLRTKRQLEAQGIRCVSLDLTQFGGQQATGSEWYFDLTYEIGKQLGLPDATAYWQRHGELSPLYRFSRYLRDEVLLRLAAPVVIFLDELDALLAVPGVARDDFFAAIRALYNARADDPTYARLTFCLFGVAMPGDLVQDELRTPFNIGRCITLLDFTRAELSALRPGLLGLPLDAELLLDQIYYWTAGHPYMTQKLGAALFLGGSELRDAVADVGQVVERLFLRRGRVLETNLANAEKYFARQNGSPRIAQMLWLYGRLCAQERVPAQGQDPCQMALRLTGLAAERSGDGGELLVVRNRIFARVFDAAWVKQRQAERLFTESMFAWLESSFNDDFLLRGEALYKAQAWARGREDITPDERRFLIDSLRRAQTDAEQREREQAALRKAEVESLRRQQLEAQSRTRRQIIIGLLFAVLCLLAALLVLRHQYAQTKHAKEDAENMHRAAESARAAAEAARMQAERSAQRARSAYLGETRAKQLAEQREQLALSSMRQAAQLAERAQKERQKAEAAAQLAARQSQRADEERQAAEAAREQAEQASRLATQLKGQAEQLAKERYQAQQQLIGANLELQGVQAALLASGRQSKTQALLGGMRAVAAALKSDHALTPTILRGLIAATAPFQHPLNGHRGPVRSAVFSADGRLVLTAGGEGVARVWDAETGAPRATLWSPLWFLDLLALSPDGRRLASVGDGSGAGEAARIKLWTFEPHRLRLGSAATLAGHKDLIRSIQFSADGERVLTASEDETARIFRVGAARPIVVLAGHEGPVLAAAFSPDGTRVATVSRDCTTRLWDAHTGSVLRILGPYEHPAQALAFAPRGGTLAVSGLDGDIYLYQLPGATLRQHIAGNATPVSALAFSPDGRRLVAAGADGALRTYDADSGQFLFPLLGHRSGVLTVAFSPDGSRVVSGSADGSARISFATIEGFFAAGCRSLAHLQAARSDHAAPLPELPALLSDCAAILGHAP